MSIFFAIVGFVVGGFVSGHIWTGVVTRRARAEERNPTQQERSFVGLMMIFGGILFAVIGYIV